MYLLYLSVFVIYNSQSGKLMCFMVFFFLPYHSALCFMAIIYTSHSNKRAVQVIAVRFYRTFCAAFMVPYCVLHRIHK